MQSRFRDDEPVIIRTTPTGAKGYSMRGPLLGFLGGRLAEARQPLRAELLSIERLEERAKALAASFTLARNPRRQASPFFARLDENARVLREAYRIFSDDVHRGAFIPPAAEWLLDNFHLIEGEIRDTRHDLPRQYYLQLPKLASREMAGIARVYAMALELIRHTDGRLERQQLAAFRHRLPDSGPPDHRRALGLAQHAQAGAHREPAAARGRDDSRDATRVSRPTATSPRSTTPKRRCRWRPSPSGWRRPTSCVCCSGCASTAPSSPRCAPPSRNASPPRA